MLRTPLQLPGFTTARITSPNTQLPPASSRFHAVQQPQPLHLPCQREQDQLPLFFLSPSPKPPSALQPAHPPTYLQRRVCHLPALELALLHLQHLSLN